MREALFEIYTWILCRFITFMRNKQVEFNPYILYFNYFIKIVPFGYEISVFNTKHPVIILRVSLFAVTPSHVASTKIEYQNFSLCLS